MTKQQTSPQGRPQLPTEIHNLNFRHYKRSTGSITKGTKSGSHLALSKLIWLSLHHHNLEAVGVAAALIEVVVAVEVLIEVGEAEEVLTVEIAVIEIEEDLEAAVEVLEAAMKDSEAAMKDLEAAVEALEGVREEIMPIMNKSDP